MPPILTTLILATVGSPDLLLGPSTHGRPAAVALRPAAAQELRYGFAAPPPA